MKQSTLFCMALALSTSGALAQAPPSENDGALVSKASVGNTFEVEEAKLALERATDPRLKAFAKTMISDHEAAEKKLQAAAGKADEPEPKMMLDQPHQAMVDNLKSFQGQDFDKIYIADQIAAHAETMGLLLDYKQNGKTSSLKTWVDGTLPVVEHHLHMIQAM